MDLRSFCVAAVFSGTSSPCSPRSSYSRGGCWTLLWASGILQFPCYGAPACFQKAWIGLVAGVVVGRKRSAVPLWMPGVRTAHDPGGLGSATTGLRSACNVPMCTSDAVMPNFHIQASDTRTSIRSHSEAYETSAIIVVGRYRSERALHWSHVY